MDTSITTLLHLRLLVGFLGERNQYGWWPTAFFGDYSRRSLEFIAPKTASLAQYHGAVEAARRLHDDHLSVGSYHLFRLPEEVEQDLHALMLSADGAQATQGLPTDKGAALSVLEGMAEAVTEGAEGPLSLGRVTQLNDPTILSRIAGTYHRAMTTGVKAYPYLVG
jgi:hypothetical protein